MENRLKHILNALIFLAGFASCALAVFVFSLSANGMEMPFSAISGIYGVSGMPGNDSAPGDWINLNQITLTGESITIRIPNASLSSYAPTGSMKPVFDEKSNGIRIVPQSAEQIKVGDIITFTLGNDIVVHRVIEKGEDSEGYWFLTKGDNNPISDEVKIRFSQIKYITIAVLY